MFNQRANFTGSNSDLELPGNFATEETYGGGDCFFDSVAKGLRQLKPDIQFTVESLRMVCKDLARDNQAVKEKVINDTGRNLAQSPNQSCANSFVDPPHPDVSDDELWDFYLNNIECTRNNIEKINTKDNRDRRYGSTLHVPIWGRPEIEGQMICQKYNVKLHVIEYHPGVGLLHQIIDSSGSQSVENINYDEENIVHIINENDSHFRAIIRQEDRSISPTSNSSDGKIKPEGVSSPNLQTSNPEKNYLELIQAREEKNEVYKEILYEDKKYIKPKDYSKIGNEEIQRIIKGIAGYYQKHEEKEEIVNFLKILFRNTTDSTFPVVYETFLRVHDCFSEGEEHIFYEELCYLILLMTESLLEERKDELRFLFIVWNYAEWEWLNELVLMDIENYLQKDLEESGEECRWRNYLDGIEDVNIRVMFKDKLNESPKAFSSKEIEDILYLLYVVFKPSANELGDSQEKIDRESEIIARLEKVNLSKWPNILKQEYWVCKLSEVFPNWNREKLLENAINLLELENEKGAELVEDFVNILNEKQLKLLPGELKEFLQNFRNKTWKFDEESLTELSKAKKIQSWIGYMNSLTSQKDLSINKLVELVENNKATTSEGILENLPKIKESINNINKKEYPSSILANSTDCKKPISSFTEDDIKRWVEEFKEHRKRSVGEKDQYIKETHEEVLAVVDRAIELKRGFKLRDTQKLAVLAMFTNERNTLAQVSTGEGKSLIVVASAVMQVLYGKKVDIVTSSPVLAKRDVEEPPAGNSDIYELFDISVSHNCSENIEERKRSYSAEVVYGDLSNFQRDYLLHTFYDKNVFGDRNFESVIVDEVDSMLLDGANKMLYLTHRLADLDKLEPVYLYIWQKVNLARNEEEFSTEKIKEDVLNELYGMIKKEDLKKLDSELNTEQIDEIWGNLIKANVLDSQGKLLKQSIDNDFGFDDYRDRINYLLNEQVKREKQVYVPNYLKPFVEHSLEA